MWVYVIGSIECRTLSRGDQIVWVSVTRRRESVDFSHEESRESGLVMRSENCGFLS